MRASQTCWAGGCKGCTAAQAAEGHYALAAAAGVLACYGTVANGGTCTSAAALKPRKKRKVPACPPTHASLLSFQIPKAAATANLHSTGAWPPAKPCSPEMKEKRVTPAAADASITRMFVSPQICASKGRPGTRGSGVGCLPAGAASRYGSIASGWAGCSTASLPDGIRYSALHTRAHAASPPHTDISSLTCTHMHKRHKTHASTGRGAGSPCTCNRCCQRRPWWTPPPPPP